MNTSGAYLKVEGIIRDNEGITKMEIIREAWKVGIGERMTRGRKGSLQENRRDRQR